MKEFKALESMVCNTHILNTVPLEFPMNEAFKDEEYVCAGMKVIVVYPEISPGDESIKHEVREIMVSTLHDQMAS